MGHLLGQIIFGLVVGILAKLLMPGRDPGGVLITIALGIIGAIVGTFIGRALWGGPDYIAGWVMSIIGSMLLLFGYRAIASRTA